MGFTITSAVVLPGINLTVTNLYVTISGNYKITKVGTSSSAVYVISSPYTTHTSRGKQVLTRGVSMVSMSVLPADIYTALYNQIKNNFPGGTFIDN
jgi:hypothetical protein